MVAIEVRGKVRDTFVGSAGVAGSEAASSVAVHAAHPLHAVFIDPILLRQLVDSLESRLRRQEAGLDFLFLWGPVVVDVEPPDQWLQRQTLPHEGDEDDAEGQKEDEIAATYKSVGRKISNTSSGASSTSGTPRIKPRTNPPRTRKIGYGTSRTSESNTRPATATSNPKTMSSKCCATANSLRSTRPCRCKRAPAASVPPRRPPPTKPQRSRAA